MVRFVLVVLSVGIISLVAQPGLMCAGEPKADGATTVAARIKALIPRAAGMSVRDGEALCNSPGAPDWKRGPGQSLTLFLVSREPGKVRLRSWEDQQAEFEFHFTPKAPRKFGEVMVSSILKGYSSGLQPDSITDVTCNLADDDHASGTFAFQVEDLFRGKIQYSAEKRNDKWVITEFRLPLHFASLKRGSEGKWTLTRRLFPRENKEYVYLYVDRRGGGVFNGREYTKDTLDGEIAKCLKILDGEKATRDDYTVVIETHFANPKDVGAAVQQFVRHGFKTFALEVKDEDKYQVIPIEVPGASKVPKPTTSRVLPLVLKAGESGRLKAVEFRGEPVSSFQEIQAKVRVEEKAAKELPNVEFFCDPNLRFDYVEEACLYVSGYPGADGKRITCAKVWPLGTQSHKQE